jgi:hypothetical protein
MLFPRAVGVKVISALTNDFLLVTLPDLSGVVLIPVV